MGFKKSQAKFSQHDLDDDQTDVCRNGLNVGKIHIRGHQNSNHASGNHNKQKNRTTLMTKQLISEISTSLIDSGKKKTASKLQQRQRMKQRFEKYEHGTSLFSDLTLQDTLTQPSVLNTNSANNIVSFGFATTPRRAAAAAVENGVPHDTMVLNDSLAFPNSLATISQDGFEFLRFQEDCEDESVSQSSSRCSSFDSLLGDDLEISSIGSKDNSLLLPPPKVFAFATTTNTPAKGKASISTSVSKLSSSSAVKQRLISPRRVLTDQSSPRGKVSLSLSVNNEGDSSSSAFSQSLQLGLLSPAPLALSNVRPFDESLGKTSHPFSLHAAQTISSQTQSNTSRVMQTNDDAIKHATLNIHFHRSAETIYDALFPTPRMNKDDKPQQLKPSKRWDDPDTDSDEEEEPIDCPSVDAICIPCDIKAPPRIGPSHVDRQWFRQTMISIFHSSFFFTQRTSNFSSIPSIITSSDINPSKNLGQSPSSMHILSTYFLPSNVDGSVINAAIIDTLINDMIHEDERIISPRLGILKALYQAGSTQNLFDDYCKQKQLRKIILQSLYFHVAQRLHRCWQLDRAAKEFEVDVNHLASFGMTDYFNPDQKDLAFSNYIIRCDLDGTSRNKDLLVESVAHMKSHSNMTKQSKSSLSMNEEKAGIVIRDHIISSLELLQFIIKFESSELQKYLQLGPVSCDDIDMKTFFSHACESLDFAIDIVLPNILSMLVDCCRGYGFALGTVGGALEQPQVLTNILTTTELMLKWSFFLIRVHENPRLEMHFGDPPLQSQKPPFKKRYQTIRNHIFQLLLRKLLKYWPMGNYIREIAFLKVCEITLRYSTSSDLLTPTPIRTPVVAQNTVYLNSSPLRLPEVSSITFQTIRKIIASMLSSHFKVAHFATNLLQDRFILFQFLLNQEVDDVEEKIVEMKETLLDLFIQNLRKNRNAYWHPMVQQVTATALDTVFEYMI